MSNPAAPYFHDTGAGAPLLFLHAFPLEASQWDAQVAALSGDWRCLRPDFWGCGSSPPPPPEPTLEGYAQELLRWMDATAIESFTVVGLSLGGYIAFELWRLAAERIRALVLADTRAGADGEAARAKREEMAQSVTRHGVETIVEENVARLLAPSAREHAHITDPLRGRIRRWSPAGVAAAQAAMARRRDSSGLLEGIGVPTLVVCGAEDAVTPPSEAQSLAATIANARLEIIPSAGHLSNLESPHQFTALLTEFLDTTVAASAGMPAGA